MHKNNSILRMCAAPSSDSISNKAFSEDAPNASSHFTLPAISIGLGSALAVGGRSKLRHSAANGRRCEVPEDCAPRSMIVHEVIDGQVEGDSPAWTRAGGCDTSNTDPAASPLCCVAHPEIAASEGGLNVPSVLWPRHVRL